MCGANSRVLCRMDHDQRGNEQDFEDVAGVLGAPQSDGDAQDRHISEGPKCEVEMAVAVNIAERDAAVAPPAGPRRPSLQRPPHATPPGPPEA